MASQFRQCSSEGGQGEGPPSGVRPRDTFRSFVDEQSQRALRELRRLGIREEDALDLLQSSLLYTWEHHRDAPPGEWAKWLRSALWNARAMARRGYARAKKHEAEIASETCMNAAESALNIPAEAALGAGQVQARIREAVEALEPGQRLVAHLHFVQDIPLDQIASEHELPYELVKKRWRLAKDKIRAAVLRSRERERRTSGFVSFTFLLWLWKGLRSSVIAGGAPVATGLVVGALLTGDRPAGPALAMVAADSTPAPFMGGPGRSTVQTTAAADLPDPTPTSAPPPPSTSTKEGSTATPLAARPRATARPRTPPPPQSDEAALSFLSTAAAALEEGNHSAARTALNEYLTIFPGDPHPEQHQKIKRAIEMIDRGKKSP